MRPSGKNFATPYGSVIESWKVATEAIEILG